VETPIRVLGIAIRVFRVCQHRKGLPGFIRKWAGSEKKRVKGAWNKTATSHIGTVCQKVGFDDRLENVYEGKKQIYHIEEMGSYVN